MRGIRIRYVRREDMQNFIKLYSKSYENIKEYAYTTRKDMKRYFKWLLQRDAEGFFVAEICDFAQIFSIFGISNRIYCLRCELVQSF